MMSHLPSCVVLAAASLVAALPLPARAQPGCPDTGTRGDALRCLQRQLDQAEAALDAKYKAVAAALNGKDLKKQLADTETTWKRYRAQSCDGLVSSTWNGGSIRAPEVLDCKVTLTRQRTDALDHIFEQLLH